MHEFKFKKKQLYCESVPVKKIADKVGTPLYVYSRRTIVDHYRKSRKPSQRLNLLSVFL